jgi:two-component system sensor histidine kinase KdpD
VTLQDFRRKEYAVACVTFVAVSVLNLWLARWVGYEAIALVYLLAVVFLALFVNRGPTLVGTALTALGWNFLFAPPRFSFHIAGFYDKMMLATYFLVALTVGQLTAKLRAQSQAEQQREERATALYLLTQELADATDLADVIRKVGNHVGRVFGGDVVLLLASMQKPGALAVHGEGAWQLSEAERTTASQALETKRSIADQPGASRAGGIYVPLSAGQTPAGVLGLRLRGSAGLTGAQLSLLQNLAGQVALALDRRRLREAENRSKLLAESERLGRTLLNSVSHELRTPIAAIATAAHSLRVSASLTPKQLELAGEIETATARLNRFVHSLLGAARIQSGHIRPRMDWCDLADLVRATQRNLREALNGRPVEVRIAPGLPLAKADFALTEQALANLLVNAATHTPQGTPIEVAVRVEGKSVLLEVADRGPGLPPDELERIFDLFHQLPAAKSGGTGLGLAIVKGFIEAQGGQVKAANRPGGGAVFSIFLPTAETPDLPVENA